MNILGFNPSHHGSVCLLQDGELTHFIQEERIGGRVKYDNYPVISFIDLLSNYKIDYIASSPPYVKYPAFYFDSDSDSSRSQNEDPTNNSFYKIASKYWPDVEIVDFSLNHHITHCAHSFYNSGFKESIGVVIDGLGSVINISCGQETETIFKCSYPHHFEILHKEVFVSKDDENLSFLNVNLNKTKLSTKITLSRTYEAVTMHLGWSRDEAGKTMGLAPYGKDNPNLPDFFQINRADPDVICTDHETNDVSINLKKSPNLKLPRDPKEWHHNKSKITDLEKDLAWKIQNNTQQIVGDYIEKAIEETGLKQVCCAGGYFLNCVTNYYLKKRFSDIEFYFEPIANDAGTAIGAAKLLYYAKTKDTTIRPFKSLYLGKQYSKDELMEGIKKHT